MYIVPIRNVFEAIEYAIYDREECAKYSLDDEDRQAQEDAAKSYADLVNEIHRQLGNVPRFVVGDSFENSEPLPWRTFVLDNHPTLGLGRTYAEAAGLTREQSFGCAVQVAVALNAADKSGSLKEVEPQCVN